MKRKKIRGSDNLMGRILKHYFLIILVFSVSIFYILQFYQKVSARNREYISEALKMQSFIHAVTGMYENASNNVLYLREEYYGNYQENYTEAYEIISALYGKYGNDHSYIYRDLYVVLESYHEMGETIFQARENRELSTIYMRDDLRIMSILLEFLSQHAYLAMEDRLYASSQGLALADEVLEASRIYLPLMVAGLILLCAIFAYTTSRYISRPLRNLAEKFRKVADGDLTIRDTPVGNDVEINTLIVSFNSMVEELQQSMDAIQQKNEMELRLQEANLNNIKMEKLLRESELKFLQMQINPHFLFNTLNSICALAQIEGAGETRGMVSRLSNLMRYTLSVASQMVPLCHEIDITEDYLFIQKARFGPRLDYEIQVEQGAKTIQVPAMILQPLVENAIVHGLDRKAQGGQVRVHAGIVRGCLELCVSDNGVGMDKNTLKRLFDSQAEERHDTRNGIGLVNVHRRLEMLYGEDPMEIESIPGKGTKIRLRFSLKMKSQ